MENFSPSSSSKIAVLDSGIGGTTTLREIKKLLPAENFLYFGDSKNCPYGEKSDAELLEISKANVARLLKEDIKLIVVACNTLTTRVLKTLRCEFPEIDFIGTEPALKPALESSAKKIAVLSTPATAESLEKRLSTPVLSELGSAPKIFNLSCPGLAAAIESRDESRINETLTQILEKVKEETRQSVELVVLGCTHYPIIKEKIKPFFPNARLIDGNAGVARRVKALLEQKNLLNLNKESGVVEYIYT